jgi:DNA polymerase-3 subunit alpha
MEITDIDPLQNELLFERFLNPERISMPDIDIDFCMNRRGEVIEYVTRKYGRDQVAQIITFNTMAAKAAIKDVGRAFDMPYGEVDRIAKMIPPTIGITIDQALKDSPPLARPTTPTRRSRSSSTPLSASKASSAAQASTPPASSSRPSRSPN